MIECQVGKGTMTEDECLKCARAAVLPICGFEYSFLRAMYSTFNDDRNGEIHVTDLVHCLRKSYLDKRSPIPEKPSQMLAKWKGIAIHDFIEGKNAWAIAEQELEYEGVKGRTDVLYDGILVDYKTAKDIVVDRLPYAEHELQLNIYAYMLEKLNKPVKRLVLVYISNRGPSECSKCRKPLVYQLGALMCPVCERQPNNATFGVKAIEVPKMSTRDVEKIFRSRKMQLETALKDKQLPAASPDWLCAFCKHECDERIP